MDESQDHFDKILYQGSITQTHPFCWHIPFTTCYALLKIDWATPISNLYPANLLVAKVMKSSLLVTKNALQHHSNEMTLACFSKFVFLL